MDIADALEANENSIRVENEADVVAAQQAGYEKSLISRLMLKPGKARDYPILLIVCGISIFLTVFYFLIDI